MATPRHLLPAALLALGSAGAYAAPGDLSDDWGFFNGGKQFVAFDLDAIATDNSSGSVVGPDGSLYLAGTVRDANGLQRIGVAKLDPDGQLDPSFSADGKNTSQQANLVGTAVALDGDFLYVTGYSTAVPTDHDMVVCRFRADSGVNLNFPDNANSNCVKPQFLPGTRDMARDILVQPDGKFVIGGSIAVNDANDTYAAFARFHANGQPDTTFGTLQGSNVSLIRTNGVYARHSIQAITLTSTGGIAGAGSTVFVNDTDASALVVRLEADGTLISEYSFARDGGANRDTALYDVVALDDPNEENDYLFVAGAVEMTVNTSSGFLAKINSFSNVLVSSFGEGSGFTTITPPDATLAFTDIALDGNRSIIAHGQRTSANGIDMVVRRFDMDGIRDDSFGNNGNAIIDFDTPSNTNVPSGLVVSGDDVYATGSILWTASNYDFAAAKLTLSDSIFGDGFED